MQFGVIGQAVGEEGVEDAVVTMFVINAAPKECGRTGIRTFFADESGVIRFTNDQDNNCPAATKDDPPI